MTLEQRDHLAFGDIRRAIESHVLDEMRHATLVISFAQRAHIEHHPHRRDIGWSLIGQDRIAQAILEPAIAHGGIGSEIAGILGPDHIARAVSRLATREYQPGKHGQEGEPEKDLERHDVHRFSFECGRTIACSASRSNKMTVRPRAIRPRSARPGHARRPNGPARPRSIAAGIARHRDRRSVSTA